ncbi:hypothetical protein GDO78_017221 [Eleutherodactylus coqui]|uniref:Uncharacterized protein n=1 Tax=Eleutherodactylus coqui TaxID=57060 RepID=A0A8J6EJZ3_ELECQ|nr:hypothetical protein GDO78_017221 [Eleutherodactylus coqui]
MQQKNHNGLIESCYKDRKLVKEADRVHTPSDSVTKTASKSFQSLLGTKEPKEQIWHGSGDGFNTLQKRGQG